MKVGGVVVIVVLLHLLIVGGAFLIPGCRGNQAGETRSSIASQDLQGAGAFAAPSAPAPEGPAVAAPTPAPTPAPAPGRRPLVGTAAAAAAAGRESGRSASAPAPRHSAGSAGAMPATYTVQKGDTLWGISQQFGISMSALQASSGVSGATIVEGQVLRLPAGVDSAAAPAPRPPAGRAPARSASASPPTQKAASAPTGPVYRVQHGDSLWTIAKAAGVTVAELKAANNMTGEMIRVDQELVIPGKGIPAAAPAPADPLPLMPPDSAGAASPAGPAQAAAPGAGTVSTPPTAAGTRDAALPPGYRRHTMRDGELVNQVARSYGVTSHAVLEANQLISLEQIKPGMTILIPPTTTPGQTLP